MVLVGRGVIHGSNIVLYEPLTLPEGTEVVMQIEPVVTDQQGEKPETLEEFMQQPWFGMWKDREDMAKSEDWV